MDSQASERVNTLLASIETEWNIAIVLFLFLSFTLTFIVKKNNNLSIKEALFFIVGLKKVKTSWKEKLLHLAAIIIPLLIIVIAIQSNNAT